MFLKMFSIFTNLLWKMYNAHTLNRLHRKLQERKVYRGLVNKINVDFPLDLTTIKPVDVRNSYLKDKTHCPVFTYA